ncbi:MAG: PEP-CTERM sorting domain-containing protein [Aliiglaciecola sp.]|uniref:PEP-CTERM sorting domain-containing protein n=1 Tax=Aliiglaciecola sp. TaxID=1872441 RepID=UPI003297B092
MKSKFIKGLVASFVLTVSGIANAGVVTGENFDVGLNIGFEVGDSNSPADAAVDWFIFDSNGVDATSFYFNRTIAAPDLIAGLYLGDTYGFDYVAAGVPLGAWSYYYAATYNSDLTFVSFSDDSHNDSLGGPFGDPDFNTVLAAGRYSLALSSLDQGGTYEFTTNVQSAYAQVPEPSTIVIFALGLMGLASRKYKKQA